MRVGSILLGLALILAVTPVAWAQTPACKTQKPVPIQETFTFPPYPDESKRMLETGTSVLDITVAADGIPSAVTVKTSSGHARLDERAVSWVKENYRYQKLTKECESAQTMVRIAWTQSASFEGTTVTLEQMHTLEDLLARANRALQDENLDTAHDLFTQILATAPASISALIGRGFASERKGEDEKALADYDRAVALNPENPVTYRTRCRFLAQRGIADKALEDCDKAAVMEPRVAATYHFRGTAYLAKGDRQKAIADFDEAIRLAPSAFEAYALRGRAYGLSGNFRKAIEDLSEAIRLRPTNMEFYMLRATARHVNGDYDGAITDFDLLLKRDASSPLVPLYYLGRADAYLRKGDYDRAIAGYSEVIALQPKNAAPLNGRCWARALANKELERARSDCETALAVAPGDASSLDSRGLLHFRLGEYDKAIADYDAALRATKPNPAFTIYKRGLAKIRKGDQSGGRADLDQAMKMDPRAADDMIMAGILP